MTAAPGAPSRLRSPDHQRTSRSGASSILIAACTLDMASRILPEHPVPLPAKNR